MRAAVLLLLALALVSAAQARAPRINVEVAFAKFVAEHGRQYGNAREYATRKGVFAANLRRMDELRASNPLATFGVNKFADMTQEEFAGMYLNYVPASSGARVPSVKIPRPDEALPTSFDWRSHVPSPVTPVKDQGQCGSCWAFSATEEIESAWILAGHNATILAPQQIVDCDRTSLGCNGGDPKSAYNYVLGAGGLELEAEYPYTAKHGACEASGKPKAATLTSWRLATSSRNETELLYAVAQIAPISICVDASTWQSYTSGVLTQCGEKLDHCVQLTGFGQTEDATPTPTWSVRNSWSEQWGEDGYIRIARGNDVCGIAKEATVVIG